MELYLIYIGGIAASLIEGKITLLNSRAGIAPRGTLGSLLSIAGGLAFMALVVWGLFGLPWYWALLILFVGAMGLGFLVTARSHAAWLLVSPVLDVVAIGAAVWLWIVHQPF